MVSVSGGRHRERFNDICILRRKEIERTMLGLEYTIANGRRVLRGLTCEETNEFEILCAMTPMYGTPSSPHAERRWRQLRGKHESALHVRGRFPRGN